MKQLTGTMMLCCLFFIAGCGSDNKDPAPASTINADQNTQQRQQPQQRDTQALSSAATVTPMQQDEPVVEEKTQPAGQNTPAPQMETTDKPATDESTTANSKGKDAMLVLANKSGCLACHAIDHKVVGPAWKDVASRYKTDATAKATLVAKVKKGGRGNWTKITGGAVMPPYSPRVTDENITRLVEFVLQLN